MFAALRADALPALNAKCGASSPGRFPKPAERNGPQGAVGGPAGQPLAGLDVQGSGRPRDPQNLTLVCRGAALDGVSRKPVADSERRASWPFSRTLAAQPRVLDRAVVDDQ